MPWQSNKPRSYYGYLLINMIQKYEKEIKSQRVQKKKIRKDAKDFRNLVKKRINEDKELLKKLAKA